MNVPRKLLILIPVTILIFVACSFGEGETEVPESVPPASSSGVPTLVDLGSNSCTPCRLMTGELESLDSLTGERLDVIVIDVNEDPDAASEYGVRLIPTQVFLSGDGEELFRHEGFISCEEMLTSWETLGYNLTEGE